MKNLQKLQRDGLLVSDSYGVKMEGKEKFWRILSSSIPQSSKRRQQAVLNELGLTETPWKIHASLYDHEKASAEVFVSLAVTGTLMDWQGEGDQKAGFRHDRRLTLFDSNNPPIYLEQEMGNHGNATLKAKVTQYRKLFDRTGNPFKVVFAFPTEKDLEDMVSVFEECEVGFRYAAALQSELVSSPLTAQITHRFDTVDLSKYASNYNPHE